VPATATFFVTGNNLIIGGDLPRRTLLSRLDAKTERPELREFEHDVEDAAFNERGKLVAAVLTMLRAWQVAEAADKASVKAKPLGLFKRWSHRVQAPLLWLGCADRARASRPSARRTRHWVSWRRSCCSGNRRWERARLIRCAM